MIGIYVTAVGVSQDRIAAALSTCARLVREEASQWFVAAPDVYEAAHPLGSGHRVSLFQKLPADSMSGALLMPPARLFCDAYGAAMIAHIAEAVRPGGWFLLPFVDTKTAKKTGQKTGPWHLEWLRGLLGKEQDIFKAEKLALFRRRQPLSFPQSIFHVFSSELEELSSSFFANRPVSATAEFLETCNAFLAPPVGTDGGRKAATEVMKDLRADLASFLRYVTYSVTGVAYKTAALREFASRYLADREDLRVIDLGGGIGLVDLELLLTSPSIRHVTNVEPVASVLPITKHIFERFEHSLKGRFEMALCAAQDFPFDREVDIVCEFAALLYIPRDKLVDTLDRAWNALRPGGILVIHENIKRPIFEGKNYYDLVFDVAELESYLGRYGEITYYRSSDFREMKRRNAKDQTVFRIVRKAEQ